MWYSDARHQVLLDDINAYDLDPVTPDNQSRRHSVSIMSENKMILPQQENEQSLKFAVLIP